MKKLSILIFIFFAFVFLHPMQVQSQSLVDKIKTELRKTGDVIKRNINPKDKGSSGTANENASNAGKSNSAGGSDGVKQHK
jgi:hypothetical protein